MKAILFLAVLALVPNLAQASSFNIDCTNAHGTLKIIEGHMDNVVEYSVWDSAKNGYKVIRVDLQEMNVETSQENELHQHSQRACHNGFGSAIFRSVTTKKVRVSRADGGPLDPSQKVKVGQEALEDFLICERVVTNILPCNK